MIFFFSDYTSLSFSLSLVDLALQLLPVHLFVVFNLGFQCFCTDLNDSLSPFLKTLFFLVEELSGHW